MGRLVARGLVAGRLVTRELVAAGQLRSQGLQPLLRSGRVDLQPADEFPAIGRGREVAPGLVEFGELTKGEQVLGVELQHALEGFARCVVVAALQMDLAEDHVGAGIPRVPVQARVADPESFLEPTELAETIGQRSEDAPFRLLGLTLLQALQFVLERLAIVHGSVPIAGPASAAPTVAPRRGRSETPAGCSAPRGGRP